jgi:hypothetical protein
VAEVTIAAPGVVAIVLLDKQAPITPSYVVGMVVWDLLCITVWWMLSRPRP